MSAPTPRPAGQELVQLFEALPTKHNIIGIDLAPGMVEVAQRHIRRAPLAIAGADPR
jgi:hypothetical protein